MGEPQKGYINYSIVVRKEGKQYSCWCPELDVASSGDSIEQATKNLEDAFNCLFETYAELVSRPRNSLTKSFDLF
jgi:predicted RNase H-like HicB family nuclease